MPQDAITLNRLAVELNNLLSGAKVNKVTQPNAEEIILGLYTKNKNSKLCVSSNATGARVGFTELERKNPLTPPAFCMLLRKHLLNSTIKKVTGILNERIIKIEFDGKNEFMESVEKQMYCEIMGKYSNIIFCENNVILGCIKSSPLELGKERMLLVGAKYALPKKQDKTNIFDKEESIKLLSQFNSGALDDFIFNNFIGFAPATAKELVYRFFGKTDFNSNLLKVDDFYDFIIKFINNFYDRPTVIYSLEKIIDYTICDYQTVSGTKKYFEKLCDAECFFFDEKQRLREYTELKNKLLSAVNARLKKENKKLQIIAEKQLSCQNSEQERKFGELITANIYKIKRGDKSVIVNDYYEENSLLTIALDEKLSPNENAQRYFKKYSKLKNTAKAIQPQREQAEQERDYLLSVLSELNSSQNLNDLNEILVELQQSGIIKDDKEREPSRTQKKIDAKINFRTFEFSGYTIRAGKNNIQNDRLTFMAKPSDIWLHVKEYHSAHVVIESQGGKLPDEILQIASEICAFYSEAQNGSKVPVDYTLKKYVKKPPKSKYGSVIYTDFKTVYVTPNAHKNLEV